MVLSVTEHTREGIGHNAAGQVKRGGKRHRKKGQALVDEETLMDNVEIFLGPRDTSEDGGFTDIWYESRCENVPDNGKSTTRGGESGAGTGRASSDDGRTDKTTCVERKKKKRRMCKYMCCTCFEWTTNFSQNQRRKSQEAREQYGIVCADCRKILDVQ